MKHYIPGLTAAAFLSLGVAFAQPPALPPAQALPAVNATKPPTTTTTVHKNLNPYKVIRTTPSMLENTLNRLVNNGYAITGILSTINQDKFTIIAFRPGPQ